MARISCCTAKLDMKWAAELTILRNKENRHIMDQNSVVRGFVPRLKDFFTLEILKCKGMGDSVDNKN